MGHFTGIHTRFAVKPDTSPELQTYLKSVYNTIGPINVPMIPLTFSDYDDLIIGGDESNAQNISRHFQDVISGSSVYFENWNTARHETADDGTISFESFSSVKYEDLHIFKMLFDKLVDKLVLRDGQIVLRSIYEGATVEKVIFFSELSNTFHITDGFIHDCVDDSLTHPASTNNRFVPAMNIYDLYPQFQNQNIRLVTNRYGCAEVFAGRHVNPYETVFMDASIPFLPLVSFGHFVVNTQQRKSGERT